MILCPLCKNADLLKQGFRYNKVAKRQKYQCLGCRKYFIEDDGFKRMRHKPEMIMMAVQQRKDGISLPKIQKNLLQHHDIRVSKQTLAKWGKKYSNSLELQ